MGIKEHVTAPSAAEIAARVPVYTDEQAAAMQRIVTYIATTGDAYMPVPVAILRILLANRIDLAAVTTERDALAVALGEAREREREWGDAIDLVRMAANETGGGFLGARITLGLLMDYAIFGRETGLRETPVFILAATALRAITAAHTTGADDE